MLPITPRSSACCLHRFRYDCGAIGEDGCDRRPLILWFLGSGDWFDGVWVKVGQIRQLGFDSFEWNI